MKNKEFGKILEQRTRNFAVSIIKFSAFLPNTPEIKVIRYQLSKAGTSVGANYREANRGRSKADFSNKIKICESECSESVFWLEVIGELNLLSESKIKPILTEANELLAIFTSIGKNLKNNN